MMTGGSTGGERGFLVVCNSPDGRDDALLRSLASSGLTVLAVDGGLSACAQAGVVPDVLIGDLDSVPPGGLDALEATVAVERYPADKDVSDLDLALEHVLASGGVRAVVTRACGGRLDHQLAVIGSLLRHPPLECSLVESAVIGEVARADVTPSVMVFGEGVEFSIVCAEPAVISVEGARWPLSTVPIEPLTSFTLSNRVQGGPSRVTVHQGAVLVLCPIAHGVSIGR